MSAPVPHTALPYIQYGTHIYTPNTAMDTLLDAILQDSCLASTLDHAIDPQSPIGFIHEAYTCYDSFPLSIYSLDYSLSPSSFLER